MPNIYRSPALLGSIVVDPRACGISCPLRGDLVFGSRILNLYWRSIAAAGIGIGGRHRNRRACYRQPMLIVPEDGSFIGYPPMVGSTRIGSIDPSQPGSIPEPYLAMQHTACRGSRWMAWAVGLLVLRGFGAFRGAQLQCCSACSSTGVDTEACAYLRHATLRASN